MSIHPHTQKQKEELVAHYQESAAKHSSRHLNLSKHLWMMVNAKQMARNQSMQQVFDEVCRYFIFASYPSFPLEMFIDASESNNSAKIGPPSNPAPILPDSVLANSNSASAPGQYIVYLRGHYLPRMYIREAVTLAINQLDYIPETMQHHILLPDNAPVLLLDTYNIFDYKRRFINAAPKKGRPSGARLMAQEHAAAQLRLLQQHVLPEGATPNQVRRAMSSTFNALIESSDLFNPEMQVHVKKLIPITNCLQVYMQLLGDLLFMSQSEIYGAALAYYFNNFTFIDPVNLERDRIMKEIVFPTAAPETIEAEVATYQAQLKDPRLFFNQATKNLRNPKLTRWFSLDKEKYDLQESADEQTKRAQEWLYKIYPSIDPQSPSYSPASLYNPNASTPLELLVLPATKTRAIDTLLQMRRSLIDGTPLPAALQESANQMMQDPFREIPTQPIHQPIIHQPSQSAIPQVPQVPMVPADISLPANPADLFNIIDEVTTAESANWKPETKAEVKLDADDDLFSDIDNAIPSQND